MGCATSAPAAAKKDQIQSYVLGSDQSMGSVSTDNSTRWAPQSPRRRTSTMRELDLDEDDSSSDESCQDCDERDRRNRAQTDASQPMGETDGVFQGQLHLMRKFYSWDDIPMEFFVDKYVDDSGKENRVRGRLSMAKKARPKSLRPRPKPRKSLE